MSYLNVHLVLNTNLRHLIFNFYSKLSKKYPILTCYCLGGYGEANIVYKYANSDVFYACITF
ncbi:MAG: hypothetical protein ACJA1H_000974 [Glaciecola sp.]|jgi:hypothetical protein